MTAIGKDAAPMTAPTPPICERLRYVAAILDANVNKFTVPDHIPAKARSVREAADTIEALVEALENVVDPLGYLRRTAESNGQKLSGRAHSISCDIGFIKTIARDALSSARNGVQP